MNPQLRARPFALVRYPQPSPPAGEARGQVITVHYPAHAFVSPEEGVGHGSVVASGLDERVPPHPVRSSGSYARERSEGRRAIAQVASVVSSISSCRDPLHEPRSLDPRIVHLPAHRTRFVRSVGRLLHRREQVFVVTLSLKCLPTAACSQTTIVVPPCCELPRLHAPNGSVLRSGMTWCRRGRSRNPGTARECRP